MTDLTDRKQYLISLIQARTDLPEEQRNKMLGNMEIYDTQDTEALIALFEKSNSRRDRILAGDIAGVHEEEDREFMQALRERERIQREKDEAEAAKLLAEIENS